MTTEQVDGRVRFEALLAGASVAAHDQALLKRSDWLIAPTLGPLIPGWLIVLPWRRVLSFRDWEATDGRSATSVLDEVCGQLGLRPDEIIWFEHGPARAGTVVGCGLDHAHLHILIRPPFDFEAFIDHARAGANLGWRETTAVEGYSTLDATNSYCVAGSGHRAIVATGVEVAGSQFFRRVVGALVGGASEWDYRQFAHSDNVEETIAIFKRLEGAAQREH